MGIVTVRPGVQFQAEAAQAFVRAEAQVQREFGRLIDVNSTYRSWDVQMAMHIASVKWQAHTGPYPGHSYATHPMYSRHVSGYALDSDDWTNPRILQILAENGFIRNQLHVPNEQHHFEYLAQYDQHRGQPAGGGSTPFEEDDMPTPEDLRPIIREEIRAALKDILTVNGSGLTQVGSAVWNHTMDGAAGPNDKQAVPRETAGARLRNIRRSTDKLKGRTETIEGRTETIEDAVT